MNAITIQWILVVGSSLLLFLIAPRAKSASAFFAGSRNDQQPGLWMLTSSLVISWLFAKSITNAANLGLQFGIVGGVAYAMYYLSFLIGGIVIYLLRTRGNFVSIHQFLETKFGKGALIVFSLLIAIRLFNEIWSNTMVIGSYFGAMGSTSYYQAILVFTGLTVAYSLKGGLSSSILTDLIQMGLFAILLSVILAWILPATDYQVEAFMSSGSWDMAGGMNLLFAALIQVWSYPFHDPVLTDRGFISPPKTTLQAYLWATIIGGVCIVLFSFVGIYAQMQGMKGQAAVEVSQSLGIGMMVMMNFIMVTSAASTLDSTFSAFSKLAVVDLGLTQNISVRSGRLAMVVLVVVGTIPVFFNPEILSATTISGTMVIGLAPVFLFWKYEFPPISFHLSVGVGVLMGLMLAIGAVPASLIFFEGKYGDLLSINMIGTMLSFSLFFIPKLWSK